MRKPDSSRVPFARGHWGATKLQSKQNMNTRNKWTVQRLPFSIVIYSKSIDLSDTQEICTLAGRTPESEANGCLIAAAPELLAACQSLLAEADDPDHPHQGCHCPACQAKIAIARATGN